MSENKIQIISLSGIHNCKKTTIFGELKEFYKNRRDILFFSEFNTLLDNYGLGINDDKKPLMRLRQNVSLKSLQEIENYLLKMKSDHYRYVIMDRCSLDVILYTNYFIDFGHLSRQINDVHFISAKNNYYQYKLIYFGMSHWVENKRPNSMDKESGQILEDKYFSKYKDIMIDFNSIEDIKNLICN